ncbi:hypothetical protein EZS27_002967 [termite gut metagenome]|uniref:Uncharacterized protein n=1 Tax=termite gut metagenome TaxID=433724 RepID=A0A5J4STX2_9ZZZZ
MVNFLCKEIKNCFMKLMNAKNKQRLLSRIIIPINMIHRSNNSVHSKPTKH